MASRSPRNSEARSSQGPNMVPVFVAMSVLVIAALIVAVMQNKQKKEEAAAAATEVQQKADEPETSNPFGDRDNSPKARGGGSMAMKNTAPAGLADTPLWVKSKVLGTAGIALVKEAVAARNKGDEETYRTKGLEGYGKLDEALMNTGDWILDLDGEHPEDRQVDRLRRERSRWADYYQKVRKIK